MNTLLSAFWAETLKARRSKVSVLTAAGFLILPLIAGLFMIILKDPERARAMGLISVKAQLAAGVADWPTFFGILTRAPPLAEDSCLRLSRPGSLGASFPIALLKNCWPYLPPARLSSARSSY